MFKRLPRSTTLALLTGIYAHVSYADTPAVEEVLVQARKGDYSVITEQAQKIIDTPGSLGDPLMAVFSLPGILSPGEFGAPAVRGSAPEDNLYLVDGAPAGYIFHAFSTSIFNENIIQDFELFSAGFGPRYGGATGGVFDIKLRDPRTQRLTTKVDISVLRAGIFVEGEVTSDSAFYLSARNSLLQYFYDEEEAEEEDGMLVQDAPEDTDYQFKYQYRLGSNHKLTLSANGATDLAAAEFTDKSAQVQEEPDFAGDAKIKNRFDNQTLHWQFDSYRGSQLDMQIGHYLNKENLFWGGDAYFLEFIRESNYALVDFAQALGENHTLSIGARSHANEFRYDGRFVNFVCTEFDPDCPLRRGELITAQDRIKIQEHLVYINDHWRITDLLTLDVGVQGHYNDLTEEKFTHPRMALSWELNDSWTLSGSAGQYNQLPDIDKVFPEMGNPELKSPRSDHYTLGIKQHLSQGWSWSVTPYYKTMTKLPLAKAVLDDADSPLYSNDTEGEAYGVDIFINKDRIDRWYGWLAFSGSRSTRTNQLTGIESNYYLDTPWVVSGVINYQLTRNWNIGSRLTAQAGRAIMPITGVKENPFFEGYLAPVYGEAYSDNLPTYVRLDFRALRETNFFGFPGSIYVDLLNLLDRNNVSDRRLDYALSKETGQVHTKDEASMGMIVSLGMSVTF